MLPAYLSSVRQRCSLDFGILTGPRGGLGAKVQRALVSEIVGYQTVSGKRTSSRIDPLQIENNVEIFAKNGGGWTFDQARARRKNGEPVKRKPSEINHGNIVPSFRHEDKNTRKPVLNHGGVTLAYAIQHSVLSLAALRRLRFPIPTIPDAVDQKISICRPAPFWQRSASQRFASLTKTATICVPGACWMENPERSSLWGKARRATLALTPTQRPRSSRMPLKRPRTSVCRGQMQPVTLQPSPDLSRLVVDSRAAINERNVGD